MEYPIVPSRGFLSGLFDATLRVSAESRMTFSSPHRLPLECIQAFFPGPIHKDGHYELDLRHPLERCAICYQVQSKTRGAVVAEVLGRDEGTLVGVSVFVEETAIDPLAYFVGLGCGLDISKCDALKEACPGMELRWDLCPSTLDWSYHARSFIEGGNLLDRFATMHKIYVANNRRHTVITESHKYFLTNRALVDPLVLRSPKREPLTCLPYRLVKEWCDSAGIPYSNSFTGLSSLEKEHMEDLFRKGWKPAKILRTLHRTFPSLKNRLDIHSLRNRRRYYLKIR